MRITLDLEKEDIATILTALRWDFRNSDWCNLAEDIETQLKTETRQRRRQ